MDIGTTKLTRAFEGESPFDYLTGEENEDVMTVPKASKKTLKLRFGKYSLLQATRQPKPVDKGKKGKKGKKGDKGSKKSKSSKSSKKSKGKPAKGKDYTYYIVKYNILLGSTFVKDIFVMAFFI